MASTVQFKNIILEQLNELDQITCKQMMGEYLLYYKNILFGGIYDNRLLIKIVDKNKFDLSTAIPYPGAKPMYLVEDFDREKLYSIILSTYNFFKK